MCPHLTSVESLSCNDMPGPLAPPREVEWRGGAVMAGEEGSEERELWRETTAEYQMRVTSLSFSFLIRRAT